MDEMHDDPRLQRVLDELRRGLTEAPEEHVAQRHLSAMRAAAAGMTGQPGWWGRVRRPREPRRPAAPVSRLRWLAAGVAALFGLTGGLAAADVLPDAAQKAVADAVSNVGLDLPRPDDGPATAGDTDEDGDAGDSDAGVEGDGADPEANDHGKTVVSVAQDPELEGCEQGQTVRDTASSRNQADDEAVGQSDDHDPCDEGDAGADGAEVGDDTTGDDDAGVRSGGTGAPSQDEADEHRQDDDRRPAGTGAPDG